MVDRFLPADRVRYTGDLRPIANQVGSVAERLDDGRYCVWFASREGYLAYAIPERSLDWAAGEPDEDSAVQASEGWAVPV